MLKKAHLLRWLGRTLNVRDYASRAAVGAASHLDLFEHPA